MRRQRIFFLLFVILGTFLLAHFSILQKAPNQGDVVIHKDSYHDALWHFTLMNALEQSVPPMNLLAQGEKVVGYHYLHDLFVVGIHYLTGISTIFLYLKVLPVFLAALFTSTTLVLFLHIFTSKKIAYLGASIALFGAGLGFFVHFFSPTSLGGQSAFWLDQTVRLGVNQQLLFSLSIVNVIFIFLYKNYLKTWWKIAILIGLVTAIKVYAAMILVVVFGVLAFWEFFKYRKMTFFRMLVVSALFILPLLKVMGNQQGFPFFWSPGWFFKTMFESRERLDWVRWELMRLNAVVEHDWVRSVILWLGAAGVFFVGNFGLKILGLVLSPLVLKKTQGNFFWHSQIILIGFCFVMPTFFLQKGVTWNTIQFLPYAYIPLVLLLTKVVDEYIKTDRMQILILTLILCISLPTTLATIRTDSQAITYLTIPRTLIRQIQALPSQYPDKTILLSENLRYESLIPAFSGKSVYWTDPAVLSIIGNPQLERKKYVEDVEQGKQVCKEEEIFITKNSRGNLKIEECPRLRFCWE